MDAIPNYEFFMEPCLRILSQSTDLVPKKKIIERVCENTGMTDEQQQMVLDSGRGTVVRSRISWALAYLKQAAAIDNPQRGRYKITERGRGLLETPDRRINSKALEQFDEFIDFRQRTGNRADRKSETVIAHASEQTPEEQLTSASKAIRAEVQSQLLEQLKEVEPHRFEQVVVDVLRAMGYGVDGPGSTRITGGTGDEGIDGIIDEDVLGLDSIYIQAKRWQGSVGRPEVQAFAGALQGKNATKGVIITTSAFSEPAASYVRSLSNSKIILIDGERLAGLMYDHGVGVSDTFTITTRKLDTDYFSTED